MSNIQDQLAHLRQRMNAVTEAAGAAEAVKIAPGDVTDWLDGAEVRTAHGAHFESRRIWHNHQRHGSVYISDLQELPGDMLTAISEGQLADVDPRKVAYLDTETTGLAGGSGTYAFLIGVGALTEAGFELRHFFMRDYAEESSQLAALAEHLERFDVLVTYNGRSYDQPLLETRYRMSRMRPPFARMTHFDLLYGARRLYRLAFESCRLVELESQILGVERIDDVPGSMIPYLYFEFLRTRSAHRMWGIFEHNAFDILTLACLTGIVPRAFHAPLEVPLHRGPEMVGLARWLRTAGRAAEAVVLLRRALDKGLPDGLMWRTIWDCGLLEKKLGNEPAALALFTELTTARNPHQAEALAELAKYYEHTEKNYALALDMTEEALRLGATAELERRRERLAKRMATRRTARLI
ncbi:MAG: ribonuclease H-like domain-containing protein [Bryobacterales bacterium]|nr:ribonuclease H-like domain-containing protein [Bryobacterales bacterium]